MDSGTHRLMAAVTMKGVYDWKALKCPSHTGNGVTPFAMCLTEGASYLSWKYGLGAGMSAAFLSGVFQTHRLLLVVFLYDSDIFCCVCTVLLYILIFFFLR